MKCKDHFILSVLCRQLLNFVCYAATDCRGHVIPGDFSMGDCCSSDNGGLSFMESGVCEDCFSEFWIYMYTCILRTYMYT